MDKNFILTMASAIFFATLVFVISEILTQSVSLVDVVVFAVIFGIGYPLLYTIFTKRMKKPK
jgi:heme O synthase-like polyprenyltransferase